MKWFVLFFLFLYWNKTEGSGDDAVDLNFHCAVRLDVDLQLPPILLLHGLSGDMSHWDGGIYEVLALQTKRRVCRADARNHGMSPKTEEFSFDLMAADIVRLLDRFKVTKTVLVGQSMGGKAAAVVALKYPDRVEKIVVEDMRPNTIAPEAVMMVKTSFEMLQKSLDAVPEGATDQEAREAVVNFLKNKMKILGMTFNDILKQHLNNILICENGKCRFSMDLDFIMKALNDPALFNKVYDGKFDGDAMFIYGSKSPFKVGEAEEEIKHLFPKAQLIPIEGAGHTVHQEKPREFLSAVIKFINGETPTMNFTKTPLDVMMIM